MIIKFSSSDQEGTHTYHRSFNHYTLKFKEEIRKCIRCKFLARLKLFAKRKLKKKVEPLYAMYWCYANKTIEILA